MKKLAALATTTLGFLTTPLVVLADELNISIKKSASGQGIDPGTSISTVISNIITIIFIFGVLAVLFMLITGAFNWITSGGDKENVGKARSRIINALIGLLVLALAFLIARVAGQIVHIDIFNLKIPSLDQP
ncbi:hypothetical protein A2631_05280 [Candidatus Daviesbacteria bacterium RIFCSPHIGHO2_01_FULL_44_29]|uniref:Uncharacterized protein n=1 Tax=Candidatus Daviesbacteria bacterium RIFCSPHIGHO2_02_FULL_43_12 TaxID=1797776 RepID=A0A1F5KH41_9BACT|nr:MAG: hypothetical protein A2631_05280 [Candidatus Daviesbacteria bacterium RIFCSPHIGHO2_01_FULL_44_29]OGE40130.1 MAG: hypothetical protein A3D25_05000 [Candidatus Daviesbacteria bacterium RIFCSPHIGHO2_02_FULL_43_12]OGE70188.1 MAG: hypothetical protein A3B55_00560 [Candidatus Daviesbacteria bacterium RIFCSPLOWO2_01_FULL_43_15]